jgi:hypothetical protein
MSTADELQAAPAVLLKVMQGDAALCLAQAAAWLDPVRFVDPGQGEDAFYTGVHEEDPTSLALYAMSIARRCFPPTYCELAEGLRRGWDFLQAGEAFSAGLRRAYPYLHLDSLYDLVYGIPLPFVGLEVTSEEFPEADEEYAALLADLFDLHPTTVPAAGWRAAYTAIDEGDFHALHPIVKRLVTSLIAEDRQPWADLAFLLMYLFSCTGNSLLDYSPNDYFDAGFEPLEWEPDMLETANEACRELAIVLDAIERAKQTLAEDEVVNNALKTNIAALKAEERIEDVTDTVGLHWPDGRRAGGAEPGADGETGSHAALVFLRAAFTEAD